MPATSRRRPIVSPTTSRSIQASWRASPLAGEAAFDIIFYQIYTQNVDGIVAGALDWSRFIGDRQYGWGGVRPTCNILIRLDDLTATDLLGSGESSPTERSPAKAQPVKARPLKTRRAKTRPAKTTAARATPRSISSAGI